MFTAFLPAVSKDALKRMSEEVRSWRIHLRTATELQDLAAWINPIVRGWMTYYGRFYRTALDRLLQRINTYLVRWAQRKYKRLRPFRKARRWWDGLTARQPRLFAHWAWMTEFAVQAMDETSGVKGDFHAPFCGSPGVRFPRHPAVPRPPIGVAARRLRRALARQRSLVSGAYGKDGQDWLGPASEDSCVAAEWAQRCQAPPCRSAPGQARVAVHEDEDGGPDRKTEHSHQPQRNGLGEDAADHEGGEQGDRDRVGSHGRRLIGRGRLGGGSLGGRDRSP